MRYESPKAAAQIQQAITRATREMPAILKREAKDREKQGETWRRGRPPILIRAAEILEAHPKTLQNWLGTLREQGYEFPFPRTREELEAWGAAK